MTDTITAPHWIPFGNRVLILQDAAPTHILGVEIPRESRPQHRENMGTIVAVAGDAAVAGLEEGMRVRWFSGVPQAIKIDDEQYLVMSPMEIGVIHRTERRVVVCPEKPQPQPEQTQASQRGPTSGRISPLPGQTVLSS